MIVSGENAKQHQAVRCDSLETVNLGELVEANDETGAVSWKDRTGAVCNVILGPNSIKITRGHSLGR